MSKLPPSYDAKTREAHWQKRWEELGVYHFRDDLPKAKTYVIDTPPPTVSGVLHMGHIFSYTQADFIARYKRMRGFDVFYPMGFDDNGLPTERLVEKTKNVRGSAMKREDFVALCREVVKDAEDEFRKLFTGVALSVDWNLLYQTVSDEVTALSQASFLDLVSKNECYRDFRPGYWDWVDQTAIATAEIEEKELQGVQITIPFGIMEKDAKNSSFDALPKVHVMTTRPELLGACVALMVHPDDKAKYEGKLAVSPLFNVIVPICFDEKVDKEKGTGFVMCCSWGDDTDKEWIAKHNLAWRPLIGKDGRLSSLRGAKSDEAIQFNAGRNGGINQQNCLNLAAANAAFAALENSKLIRDVKNENSAKGKAIKLLEEAGLLIPQGEKGELVIHKTQMVKCAERSGSAIEIIPTSQWFVKLTDKKEALKKKGAEVNWNPPHMKIRLDQWIDGLKEDWCISRQRFFGVPFPVWYDKDGKAMYADPSQLPVDPLRDKPKGYENIELTPDVDVMDTWATSSITPYINAKGFGNNSNPESPVPNPKLLPADLRPQAHEIIRTWAFYTIAKAHLHTNSIPWKDIMISGWCLAADKTKMSKSKGNVVTPVALIEDKGADAVRYWASTSRLATDTAFSEDLLKIGKKLVGKIWNASNLIAQLPTTHNPQPTTLEELERWILSRLHLAVVKATEAFDRLEYCDARVAIENFFWNDFCDNYLELVKTRAYEGNASAHTTLQICLNTILRLFAPFVPHVTEEVYSHLFADKGSVHARGNWPVATEYCYDAKAERTGTAAVEILEIIRKTKSEANVSIKFPVNQLVLKPLGELSFQALAGVLGDLKSAGTVSQIVPMPPGLNAGTSTKSGDFLVQVVLAEVAQKTDEKTANAAGFSVTSVSGNGDDRELRAELQEAGNTLDAEGLRYGVGTVNAEVKEAYKVAKVAMDKAGQEKGR